MPKNEGIIPRERSKKGLATLGSGTNRSQGETILN